MGAMRITKLHLAFCLASSAFALAPLESGKPIPVGAGDRRAPLSVGLTSYPAGWGRVSGARQPDLFVVAGAHSPEPGLYLCRSKGSTAAGVPVFAHPEKVAYPGSTPKTFPACTIYQDGSTIRGLFLSTRELIHAVFDSARLEFREHSRIQLDSLPRPPSAVGVLPKPGGGVELLFSVSDGSGHPPPGPGSRDPAYVPYDGRGIWRGVLAYMSLYAVSRASLESGPLGVARPALENPRQVLAENRNLTVVNLGPRHTRDIVSGSLFGDMYFYRNRSATGLDLEPKRLAVDTRSNALRHPIIRNSPIAYPDPSTGLSGLISGGEGALYWYRFTGRFSAQAQPVFSDPTPVLEDQASLYAGSLPVPTIVDWDGDGALDIVAGNSEGRILFFRNCGSSQSPAFASGVPLAAGGRPIHVQPGYKGDIQGPGEARWGYVSTNVIDWNGDSLPDILMGDSLSRHMVFINRGTRLKPKLDPEHPLYLDGLDLHGTWRVRPGAGKLGSRMAYVALDDQDQVHLYWRIDDYNLADGGKLRMDNGELITANFISAGGTGRSKFELFDWDGDGLTDLLIGTPRHHSIPNPQTGLPRTDGMRGATVLWLKNTGTNQTPNYRFPVIFKHQGASIYLGHHEIGASAGALGSGGPNLVISREDGRLFFFSRRLLDWGQPR
jgi:hypothetical protein